MQTKLTLRLEEQLIERAKAHAKKRGKSVSQMVADYFALLDREDRPETLAPLTRSLHGALGVLLSMKIHIASISRKNTGASDGRYQCRTRSATSGKVPSY